MDYPSGLQNTGVICWLNSVLQSLLSCKHFLNYIKTHKDLNINNTYKNLVEICESIEKSDDILGKSSLFLNALVNDLKINNYIIASIMYISVIICWHYDYSKVTLIREWRFLIFLVIFSCQKLTMIFIYTNIIEINSENFPNY